MVLWMLWSALPVSTLAAVSKTHGVPPGLLARYVPAHGGATSTFACLDGSKEVLWSAVNDDYCDCPDGSDEPGTGACPDTHFYCRNDGHIGALIPSSRVNDGLCELACCDGSDERPGVCENRCEEIGAVYRAQQEADRKLRKTGSKIRSTYIAFAQKEKKRLEEAIAGWEREIEVKQVELNRLKDLVERTESISAAALEQKKQSPLYQTLLKQHHALKSLQKEHKKHVERERALGDILNSLRSGYNPNYQDMAVLEAVRGWEFYAGLPHINDVGKEDEAEEGSDAEAGTDEEAQVQAEEMEEGEWTPEQLESDIGPLLGTNYESLLLEHEQHIGAPTTENLLFDVSAYLPDALVPQFEAFRATLLSWMETLGVVKPAVSYSADTTKAKEMLSDAERQMGIVRNDLEKHRTDLGHIFDPTWFGVDGQFKKLDGTCLEKDVADYTYELCLFNEARQRPLGGGGTTSLGRFAHWNDADGIPVGSPEYYSKQYYTQGTKCWNGPFRNVVVLWVCGLENALLTVQELEKCEYQFTATTPALCLPPDAAEPKREEL